MEIITIVAYLITAALVYFAVTCIPQALVGGVIGRLTGNILLGMFLGGLLTWLTIDLAWFFLEGGHIPIAMVAIGIGLLLLHGTISKDELNEAAIWTMTGEMWALVIMGIGFAILTSPIRWY